jgi:hypothetical protein
MSRTARSRSPARLIGNKIENAKRAPYPGCSHPCGNDASSMLLVSPVLTLCVSKASARDVGEVGGSLAFIRGTQAVSAYATRTHNRLSPSSVEVFFKSSREE